MSQLYDQTFCQTFSIPKGKWGAKVRFRIYSDTKKCAGLQVFNIPENSIVDGVLCENDIIIEIGLNSIIGLDCNQAKLRLRESLKKRNFITIYRGPRVGARGPFSPINTSTATTITNATTTTTQLVTKKAITSTKSQPVQKPENALVSANMSPSDSHIPPSESLSSSRQPNDMITNSYIQQKLNSRNSANLPSDKKPQKVFGNTVNMGAKVRIPGTGVCSSSNENTLKPNPLDKVVMTLAHPDTKIERKSYQWNALQNLEFYYSSTGKSCLRKSQLSYHKLDIRCRKCGLSSITVNNYKGIINYKDLASSIETLGNYHYVHCKKIPEHIRTTESKGMVRQSKQFFMDYVQTLTKILNIEHDGKKLFFAFRQEHQQTRTKPNLPLGAYSEINSPQRLPQSLLGPNVTNCRYGSRGTQYSHLLQRSNHQNLAPTKHSSPPSGTKATPSLIDLTDDGSSIDEVIESKPKIEHHHVFKINKLIETQKIDRPIDAKQASPSTSISSGERKVEEKKKVNVDPLYTEVRGSTQQTLPLTANDFHVPNPLKPTQGIRTAINEEDRNSFVPDHATKTKFVSASENNLVSIIQNSSFYFKTPIPQSTEISLASRSKKNSDTPIDKFQPVHKNDPDAIDSAVEYTKNKVLPREISESSTKLDKNQKIAITSKNTTNCKDADDNSNSTEPRTLIESNVKPLRITQTSSTFESLDNIGLNHSLKSDNKSIISAAKDESTHGIKSEAAPTLSKHTEKEQHVRPLYNPTKAKDQLYVSDTSEIASKSSIHVESGQKVEQKNKVGFEVVVGKLLHDERATNENARHCDKPMDNTRDKSLPAPKAQALSKAFINTSIECELLPDSTKIKAETCLPPNAPACGGSIPTDSKQIPPLEVKSKLKPESVTTVEMNGTSERVNVSLEKKVENKSFLNLDNQLTLETLTPKPKNSVLNLDNNVKSETSTPKPAAHPVQVPGEAEIARHVLQNSIVETTSKLSVHQADKGNDPKLAQNLMSTKYETQPLLDTNFRVASESSSNSIVQKLLGNKSKDKLHFANTELPSKISINLGRPGNVKGNKTTFSRTPEHQSSSTTLHSTPSRLEKSHRRSNKASRRNKDFDPFENLKDDSLVRHSDRGLTSDYVFLIVAQLKPFYEKWGNRSTKNSIGLCCRYCANDKHPFRIFPRKLRHLKSCIQHAFQAHIMQCESVPSKMKEKLLQLEGKQTQEYTKIPASSVDSFFNNVWEQLESSSQPRPSKKVKTIKYEQKSKRPRNKIMSSMPRFSDSSDSSIRTTDSSEDASFHSTNTWNTESSEELKRIPNKKDNEQRFPVPKTETAQHQPKSLIGVIGPESSNISGVISPGVVIGNSLKKSLNEQSDNNVNTTMLSRKGDKKRVLEKIHPKLSASSESSSSNQPKNGIKIPMKPVSIQQSLEKDRIPKKDSIKKRKSDIPIVSSEHELSNKRSRIKRSAGISGPVTIMRKKDKALIPDFTFVLLSQFYRIEDRFGNVGLQCKHCGGSFKIFLTSERRLRGCVMSNLYPHINMCPKVSSDVVDNLAVLNHKTTQEYVNIPKSSVDLFYNRIWERLNDPCL